jgi:hypothetical protein
MTFSLRERRREKGGERKAERERRRERRREKDRHRELLRLENVDDGRIKFEHEAVEE